MKFKLSDIQETKAAFSYLEKLSGQEATVNIIKVSPNRSLSQNAYLHLLISAFGAHFGYDIEEAKAIYKELSPGIYKYEKKGRTFWKSSAALTKEEMASSIDKFMKASAEAGYPLPLATDQEWIRQLDNVIEQSKYYL